ncbi:MAG: hypothetical protein ABFC31_00455 [Clostridiaceae bacterium]
MSAGVSVLIVSVLVLAVIGVVYSRYGRYKHEKKEAFRRYWELKGYYFGAFDEAEDEGYSLKKDDWELYVCRSREREGADWSLESIWRTRRCDPARKTFALQYAASSVPFEELPEMVRQAAISSLKIIFRESLSQLNSARTAFTQRGMACIAFEPEAGSAQRIIERLQPEIAAWSGTMKLYIESTPESVHIRLDNFFIDKPEEAEAVIRMGLILLEQNGI